MGHVIADAPPREHGCNPGWELRHTDDNNTPLGPHDYWHDLRLPAGTVWECECGKTYVAEQIINHPRSSTMVFGETWRRETRRERKRRTAH